MVKELLPMPCMKTQSQQADTIGNRVRSAIQAVKRVVARMRKPRPDHLLWGTGGLLAGLLLAFLIAVWLAPQPVTSPPVAQDAGDVTITMNDTFLTSLVVEGVAQANFPFKVTNICAHIEPGSTVFVRGDAPLLQRELTATGHLSAENGVLVMHITQATIGGLNLPAVLLRSFEQQFNKEAAKISSNLQVGGATYRVASVSSTSGRISVSLARKT